MNVWKLDVPGPIVGLAGNGAVFVCALAGGRVALVQSQSVVRVWDTGERVTAVAYDQRTSTAIVALAGGGLVFWDTETAFTRTRFESPEDFAAIIVSDRAVYAAGRSGVWATRVDERRGPERVIAEANVTTLTGACPTWDVVYGDSAGRLCGFAASRKTQVLTVHPAAVRDLAFDSVANRLVSVDCTGGVCVTELATGTTWFRQMSGLLPSCVAVSSTHVIVGTFGGSIVWVLLPTERTARGWTLKAS